MSTVLRSLTTAAISLGLVLAPLAGLAESQFVSGDTASASASLNIRIVIPPVMRVMENSHPLVLERPADGGALSAEQHLVVLSNMRHGFCVNMRLAVPGVEQWQLSASADSGVTLQPTADGYRVCGPRPGRYNVVLRHQFDFSPAPQQAAQGWPVMTDITAI